MKQLFRPSIQHSPGLAAANASLLHMIASKILADLQRAQSSSIETCRDLLVRTAENLIMSGAGFPALRQRALELAHSASTIDALMIDQLRDDVVDAANAEIERLVALEAVQRARRI